MNTYSVTYGNRYLADAYGPAGFEFVGAVRIRAYDAEHAREIFEDDNPEGFDVADVTRVYIQSARGCSAPFNGAD